MLFKSMFIFYFSGTKQLKGHGRCMRNIVTDTGSLASTQVTNREFF